MISANRNVSRAGAGALHVALDARCLNTEHVRGIGKYVQHLVHEAAAIDSGRIRMSLFGDRPESPSPANLPSAVTFQRFNQRGHRYHAWEQFGLPKRALFVGADVLHCTATTAPWWQPLPTVVTVHDTLEWADSACEGRQRWYLDTVVPAALRRCHRVITISRASASDIVQRWPALEHKIVVVPHGISDIYLQPTSRFAEPALQQQLTAKQYVLYVGGSLPRKRFAWAVDAFRAADIPEFRLVACGFTIAEQATLRGSAAKLDHVDFLGFVPEAEMPAVYANAAAVLYPTTYEGFGFPALEAQAVGTPVLFSAVGSLSELAGPGAVLLPKDDLAAWANALRAITGMPKRPNCNARNWAAAFSWHQSATKHLQVYREVLDERRSA